MKTLNNLLIILTFLLSSKSFAQKIESKDLGWKAITDFSIVGIDSFKSLYQTDSLMNNLEFLGKPTFLKREPFSADHGYGFEVHFKGLELTYRYSTDFEKGHYEYTKILFNSPVYTLKFKEQKIKVGQSIDSLPDLLKAPELRDTDNQHRMLFHFSPVSSTFQIYFNRNTRLITALEFSNTFY